MQSSPEHVHEKTFLDSGTYCVELSQAVIDVPPAIGFFSFNSPSSFHFLNTLNSERIINRNLPNGGIIVKCYIDSPGNYGYELTRSWAVAQLLGVEDMFENKLFNAIHIKRGIKSKHDIKKIFIDNGVNSIKYDRMNASPEVDILTSYQLESAKQFSVKSTPTVVINGKYLIINDGIKETYNNKYAEKLTELMKVIFNC